MAIKFIYAPTTHGNYAIVRMDMKYSTSVDKYIVPSNYSYSQWVSGIKESYPADKCFDTREEAEKYAKTEIALLRSKMISYLEKQVQYLQDKIDKLGNTDPKVRYFNWVKNG